MHDAAAFLEFVRLPVFEKQAKGLLSEDDVQELEVTLMENPAAGAVIAGTGGLRKLRFAVGGKGKSGGVRVIYYLKSKRGRVYLVTVYAKSAKDNLTGAEKNAMKQLTAVLDGDA